ncbi:MAG: calcium-binding protein, partial [Planctomycetaceae bacterium]
MPRLSRRRTRGLRRRRIAVEMLEPRLVLALTPAPDTDPLTAAQTAALVKGIDTLAQRLIQIQESGLLDKQAAGLGESLGTLSPIGDQLRTGLAERLASLSGAVTVLDVKNAFTKADDDDPVLKLTSLNAERESFEGQSRLWFTAAISGSKTLPGYRLDLGQVPSKTTTPSLLDRGLHLGDVKPTVEIGYDGTLGFGIDLAPGLAQSQAFFLKFDTLDVLAKASHKGATAIQDVDASFGIMRLGPADLEVSLDTRVRIDLAEGADGVVSLGELDGTATGQLAALLPQAAVGSGLSVTVPFKLGFGGFTQAVGSNHKVVVKATDALDPASLALTLPSLTVAGGATPFDFTKLADIKDNDLGAFLADLGHWVPELGREFEVPLVAKPFASLFGGDMLKRVDDLVAKVKSSASSWAFTTADDMVEKLAAALGKNVADLDLRWNGDANAVQWKLPLDFTKKVLESFDPGAIVPAGLPLEVAAKGSVSLTATTALAITAGVSARAPVSSTAVTSATLLSALNGGAGLTKNALIPGDDITFGLRDGTTLGFDLDPIAGLGTDSMVGTATVAGLLAVLNGPSAAGRLSATLANNRLVLTDLTVPASKDATFSIAAPQKVVMAADKKTQITQTSLAPAALGLTVMPVADTTLQGKPLASQPLRERIYVAAGDVGTANVTLSASLEAGAALGPLSLAIHKGAATGSAGITLKLTDPATVPGTTSRVTLAEMDAGIAKLVGFKLAAPKLDGIFQLKVRPQALAKDVLGIDDSKYQADPLTVAPAPADVPFVSIKAEAGDAWKFKAAPSQKLEQALQGMSDLSLDDLPKMLALFAGYLKGAPFWDVKIPWDGRTLGTFLGIESALAGFTSLDLKAILGRPDAGGTWPAASFNGLGKAFRDKFDAQLPKLSGLAQFGRLQRLSWALGDLMVRWDGWTPGVQGLDLALIGDLRGWAAEANLVFASLPADAAIKDVRLAFGRLLAFDPTKDVAWLNGLNLATLNLGGLDLGGLGGFGSVIKSLLPALPGITVDVTPSLAEVTPGGAKALAFDTTVTYAGFSTELDLDALAIEGTAFSVKGSGGIALKLAGSVTGRFGLNLSTKSAFFDAAKSSISLDASIDDKGGVTLAASLGGIAGVSFGTMGDLARVSLKDKSSSNSAQFKVTGTGVVTADAVFAATLPIYVTTPALGKVGTFAIDATLDTAKPDPFALAVSFQAGAYSSLADVFAAAISSFSLTSWLDGAILLTKTLRSTLESKFIRQLPLLSDVGSAAVPVLVDLEKFFTGVSKLDTPQDLAADINSKASAFLGLQTPLKFFVNSVEVPSTSTDKFSDLLTKASDELVVDLTLKGNSTKKIDVGEIDLGLDALGLKLSGAAGIDLAAGFTLHLGLGFSVAKGFFLKTYDTQELTGTVSLGFTAAAGLFLDLGALTLGLTDNNKAKKELEASLGIDLPEAQTTIAGLPGLLTSATPTGTVRAQLDLDLKANILGAGPGIGMVMALGYTEGGVPNGNPVSITSLTADNFFFEIADTYIDLGKLLSGPVFTLFQKIENFLDPIEPLLDLLQEEMPVVSDVSKFAGLGAVSVLDVIRYTSQGQYDDAIKLIQILTLVNEVVNTVGSLGDGSAKISLGKLSFDKLAAQGSGKDLETLFGNAADAEAMLKQLEAVGKGDILMNPAAAGGATATAYMKVTEGKLSFPVFDDPAKAIIDLIFGRNPNLIYWDMPDLLAGAEFNLPIPIFGPLFAEIFGSISFATDFKMGLDTRGIRQALSGPIDVQKVVGIVSKGIFFEDDPTPGDGDDPPELRVDARVGAGAYLDVIVASGGVRGGVEGYVGANLKDPDGDGKVHLDEFLDNLSDGIDCIFDFEGRLDAFFEAWVKLGLSTPFGMITLWSKTFDLVNETIVDWEYVTCPPPAPVIAEIATGGVYDANNDGTDGESLPGGVTKALVLNSGPRAGRVLPGETADGDEVFEVDYDAASKTYIVKAYYAEEDRNENGTIDPAEKGNGRSFAATGIQAIVFDAGIGNDVITISPRVQIPVYGWGGPGNDALTGGAGANTLFGDGGLVPGTAGRDTLTGRKAVDTLSGGGGVDTIFGYGGSDTIDGGDGDDMLYGEDEVGDMVAFIAANPTFEAGVGGIDFIVGGVGDDRIVGGLANDALYGDAGDDIIDGGAGNDVIEGGSGNDSLYGREGDDAIHGDDMLAAIKTGGIDVNADLIEGGSGFNVIYGGPGYDVIYAADATQKAAAPSTGTSGGYSSRLFGGDGCDTIFGTAGKDWIEGGFESDSIESGTGGDEVFGGPGGDCIIVAGGDARIFGGHGNDVIDGGDGTNYIEGGPGDDRIYGRGGADTIYGGTTGVGYAYLQQDLAGGKPVIAAIHGGFTAVAAEGSCGATVLYHPEVYPDAPFTITGAIFNDLDADGVRDVGEPGASAADSWTLRIIAASTLADVMIVTVPGGDFSLPSGAGLPAGTYLVVVDAVP